MELFLEVRQFVTEWGQRSEHERKAHFELIVGEFLLVGAPREACLSSSVIKRITNATELSVSLFDEAQKSAYHAMEHDIFPRFARSPEGERLAKGR